MKKIYNVLTICAVTTLALLTASSLHAQEFPWPDLGDAMIIEPGAPGTINNTITADTTATGERQHNVYILRRGATYLYTARINNVGYPLMVIAEEGEGPKPIIRALGPPPGSNEAPRAFHAQGNLYIQDLHILGWDQSPFPTDNATVRLAADSLEVVIKDCIFEFNRQNAFRINSPGCNLYVENCLVGPQGQSRDVNNGFPISFRGNFSPLVHFRNNTFFNCTRGLTRNRLSERYGTFIFQHNTCVNMGYQGADLGRPDSLVFTDNLFVNTGILGDAWNGDRDNFEEPWFLFQIDSNNVAIDTIFTEVDTTVVFENIQPYVDFSRNHFYNHPAIGQALPDSSNNPVTAEIFFDEELTEDINDENIVVAEEAFMFDGFPMDGSQLAQFIMDYYQAEANSAELPNYNGEGSTVIGSDILDFNFAYSTDHAAYSAGGGGLPVGDLNWFGLEDTEFPTSTKEYVKVDAKVFPNPTNGNLTIQLQDLESVQVFDLLGRQMLMRVNLSGDQIELNLNKLAKGTYFVVALDKANGRAVQKIYKN